MAKKARGKRQASAKNTVAKNDVFEAESDDDNPLAKIVGFIDSGKEPTPGMSDDEEIDEDEAFDDEDELMYGSVMMSINRRKEEVEEEDESTGDEDETGGLLLTDVFDKNVTSESTTKLSISTSKSRIASYDSDEGENKLESESEIESSDDDDDDSDGARENMLKLAERLAKGSKKSSKFNTSHGDEQTEMVGEGEYNIPQSSSNKVSLESLMGTLDDSKSHGELKKRLGNLEKAKSINRPESRPAMERAERIVGFKQAKEHVGRWQGVVKANREAKSVTFPLNQSGRTQSTTKGLADKFTPMNSFEEQIQSALEASGLDGDGAVMKKEEDHLKSLVSKEEMKRKHGELAKLRMLMYYEEKKAKRVKKIKSKMYRKLLKRKQAREEEKEHALIREMDPEAAKLLDEEAALKRAEERMSLRHKNTSKFMRNLIKSRGAVGEDTREIVAEQLQREEKLKRKIQTMKNEESDSESDDSSDSEIDSNGQAKRVSKDESDGNEKGIMALKFMQRGRERRRQALVDEERLLKRALDSDDDGSSDEEVVHGRRKFQLTANKKANDSLLKAVENTTSRESVTKRARSDGILGTVSRSGLFKVAEFEDDDVECDDDKNKSTKIMKSKSVTPTKKSDPSTSQNVHETRSAKNSTQKSESVEQPDVEEKESTQAAKQQESQSHSKTSSKDDASDSDDDDIEVSNPWIQSGENTDKANADESSSNKKNKKVKFDTGNMALDTAKVASLGAKAKLTANKTSSDKAQLEVMQRAFANAVSEEDFAKEKNEIEQEAEEKRNPKPVVVAGWGSWTGAGIVPRKPRNLKRKLGKPVATVTPVSTGPKHVIVSTKKNKKAAKYTLEKVPYPFTSREQYERSLQTPLGNDWNTQRTFKESIKPEVKVKKGAIIEPIKFTNAIGKMDDGTKKTAKYGPAVVEALQRNARKKEKRLRQRGQRKHL